MLLQNKHQGVAIPMITPFTREGHVDLESAVGIINRFVASEVGVFVLGTTGETASVPQVERLKLVERAVAIAGQDIPVYAGIGDNCLQNAVTAGQEYLKLGVDAVVAHLPSYYPLSSHEMHDYFQVLHDRIGGPIMIYNIPQTTSMSLPLDMVESLADLPHFVGFKDSERNEERMHETTRRLGGHEGFSLFMGSAVLSVESMKSGFQGLVPGSGNMVPEMWRDLYAFCMAADWENAQILQNRLDAIAWLFQEDRSLGQSLAAIKALMHIMGLCEPYVLPPLLALNEIEIAALAEKAASHIPVAKIA